MRSYPAAIIKSRRHSPNASTGLWWHHSNNPTEVSFGNMSTEPWDGKSSSLWSSHYFLNRKLADDRLKLKQRVAQQQVTTCPLASSNKVTSRGHLRTNRNLNRFTVAPKKSSNKVVGQSQSRAESTRPKKQWGRWFCGGGGLKETW